MMRIAIIGTSGSGKTTLARQLAITYGCPHIELDLLAWQPGWIRKEKALFRDHVQQEALEPSWVACGNYSQVRDIIWQNATHLVWLKLPGYLIFWRLMKRTLSNILMKKVVLGGNRESFYQQFFTKQSIFVWAYKSHKKRKRDYSDLLKTKPYAHLQVVVLSSQEDVDAWVEGLTPTVI